MSPTLSTRSTTAIGAVNGSILMFDVLFTPMKSWAVQNKFAVLVLLSPITMDRWVEQGSSKSALQNCEEVWF
jgi:hypothetical protein